MIIVRLIIRPAIFKTQLAQITIFRFYVTKLVRKKNSISKNFSFPNNMTKGCSALDIVYT